MGSTHRRKIRERRNSRAFYPDKLAGAFPIQLTAIGLRLMKDAQRRTKRSRGDVVERLLRLHGNALEFPEKPETESGAQA